MEKQLASLTSNRSRDAPASPMTWDACFFQAADRTISNKNLSNQRFFPVATAVHKMFMHVWKHHAPSSVYQGNYWSVVTIRLTRQISRARPLRGVWVGGLLAWRNVVLAHHRLEVGTLHPHFRRGARDVPAVSLQGLGDEETLDPPARLLAQLL